MRRIVVLAALLFFAVSIGLFVRSSAQTEARRLRGPAKPQTELRMKPQRVAPFSYRSPGAKHKLVIPRGSEALAGRLLGSGGQRRAQKYGSFTLVEVEDAELASLDSMTLSNVELRDDLNVIMLRSGGIDTTAPDPQIEPQLRAEETRARALHLVQLFGPPTPDALELVKSSGARIVSYVPNNAYLVWASPQELARVRASKARSEAVQWEGLYHPAYKLDPRIRLGSLEQIRVAIQLVDSPESDVSLAQIKAAAREVLMSEERSGGGVQVKVLIDSSALPEILKRADVVFVEPSPEYRLHDERADQIVAGVLSEDTSSGKSILRPTAPGYLAFLNSVGLGSSSDVVIDVGDTGIDTGSTSPVVSGTTTINPHPDFFDAGATSRIAYYHDFSSDPDTVAPCRDTIGHGTINASIAAGFNDKTGDAFADQQGFRYGLGTAPFARIGSSKLFDRQGRFRVSSFTNFIAQAYSGGARVSTNSWGACDALNGFCNFYGGDSETFDRLVRDADPFAPGNQEMTIVFSAGNEGDGGAGSISIPATGKNIIAVGAAENVRVGGPDGTAVTDGCGTPGSEADNAADIVSFSSLGPTQDGRIKPDIVAPGTHVQGAASQDTVFAATNPRDSGVCGTSSSIFFPLGQRLYTWSSGTSHSAPMVAGGAALAFQWLKSRLGSDPSAALVKAVLLNSARYVTGLGGGDNLPGARQGWGLLDLGRAFATTDRIILDEDSSRTFTTSGGAPFQIVGSISNPADEFRVMLVWTDPAGNSMTNAPFVNQLNLEVVINGVTYRGNNFNKQYSTSGGNTDILNNVQAVRLPAGTTGSFVIRVRPTLIAGDGVPGNGTDLDQDFALIVTNGREAAVPVLTVNAVQGVSAGVTVQHASASDSSLLPGEQARVTVAVNNNSATAAGTVSSARLVLNLPDGSSVTSGTSTWPTIPAQGTSSNDVPFVIQVPSSLRCGSIAQLELQLTTPEGLVKLPVGIRVGRPIQTLVQVVLLSDDVDSGAVKWKLKKFAVASGVANSGTQSYRAVDTGSTTNDVQLSTLLEKKQVTIPANAGNARLSFFHVFNFEPGFDGGVLEVSTDGGDTWQDLGSRAIVGGYDGKVTSASRNPLGSRSSWTARGKAGVFSQVVIDLDAFAGQTIRLRFVAGFDEATGIADGYTGWFIDDIRITIDQFVCSGEEAALDSGQGLPAGSNDAANSPDASSGRFRNPARPQLWRAGTRTGSQN